MGTLYVIPAPGLNVRDIERDGYLPPEGANVTDSPYWRRLLKYKNVTVGRPPSESGPAEVRAEATEGSVPPAPKTKSKKK
jgi:hypothetical protein